MTSTRVPGQVRSRAFARALRRHLRLFARPTRPALPPPVRPPASAGTRLRHAPPLLVTAAHACPHSPTMHGSFPMTAPLFAPGREPLPPGWTEDDRAQLLQQQKYQDFFAMGMESCPAKCAIAGVGGFGIGAFFSLMNSSFQYEDPLLRSQQAAAMSTTQRARDVFREMGTNMVRSGKGFGKVGALFAGFECVLEGVSDFCLSRPIALLSLFYSQTLFYSGAPGYLLLHPVLYVCTPPILQKHPPLHPTTPFRSTTIYP
jgi:hypothetical protein